MEYGKDILAIYDSLFLNAEDLPSLKMGETVHRTEPEPPHHQVDSDGKVKVIGDPDFTKCGCVKAGFNVWNKIQGTDLIRIVDIRWLFPSEESAKTYHKNRLITNSEGMPPSSAAPKIGSETRVFEGSDPFGLGMGMTIYLFTSGPVSAKVFVSGVDSAAGEEIARKAEARIKSAVANYSKAK